MKRKINIYTPNRTKNTLKKLLCYATCLYFIGAGLYFPIAGGFNWVEKEVFNGAVNNYKSAMADLEFSVAETNECRKYSQ